MTITTCIGCGCTDTQVCYDDANDAACHWLRVDRHAGMGVCSCCKELLEPWDGGARQMRVPSNPEVQS